MILCADCERAERELWPVFNALLCCKARAVAITPRKFQRQAFDAVTYGLPMEDVQAVRERGYVLLGIARPMEVAA